MDPKERATFVSAKPVLIQDSSAFTGTGKFVCAQGSLTEHEVDLAMQNFRAYDIDQDGAISLPDFRNAMVSHNPQWGAPEKSADLMKLFRSVDTGGRGLVCFQEFCIMRVGKKNRELLVKAPIPAPESACSAENALNSEHTLKSVNTHDKENARKDNPQHTNGSSRGRLSFRRDPSIGKRRKAVEGNVLASASVVQDSDMLARQSFVYRF